MLRRPTREPSTPNLAPLSESYRASCSFIVGRRRGGGRTNPTPNWLVRPSRHASRAALPSLHIISAGWDWSDRAYRQAARHLLTLKSEGLLGEAAACNFDTAHLRELVVDEGLPLTANQVQDSPLLAMECL